MLHTREWLAHNQCWCQHSQPGGMGSFFMIQWSQSHLQAHFEAEANQLLVLLETNVTVQTVTTSCYYSSNCFFKDVSIYFCSPFFSSFNCYYILTIWSFGKLPPDPPFRSKKDKVGDLEMTQSYNWRCFRKAFGNWHSPLVRIWSDEVV